MGVQFLILHIKLKKMKPYCLMPWIHFHVGNNGTAKACCVANIPFGNINKQSLDEIWNGKEINQLREKFRSNQPDNRCANCINREAGGARSYRQEIFEKFNDVNIEKVLKLPIYFDIRFSNVCNFRCRTCWHGASSKWFNDAKVLGNNVGDKAILQNIDDFDNFIEKSGPALLNAQEYYFAGGEPLVTEEHYLLLQWLINNKATNCRLRYNTNFSRLNFRDYDLLDLWSNFPKVEILASIDGVGALGEYIRTEMKWEEILLNREKIRSSPNIQFKIAPTVSVFNVAHLPDLYNESVRLNLIDPNGIYLNILERPHYFNIQILPQKEKNHINKIYQAFLNQKSIPISVVDSFKEVLNYLNTELEPIKQEKYWQQFKDEKRKLDELRGEIFLLGI